MRAGQTVAVFDLRASRWCRGELASVNEAGTRATVVAAEWWAVLPLVPQYVRPIAVVRS